ncbi:MAG: hypothetical protein ACLVCH_06910 [Roseburia inulinivorans]
MDREEGVEVDHKVVIERFFRGGSGSDISTCGSKENFIGHYHNYSNPAGVVNGKLDNTLNYNENSCGALF